MMRSLILKLWGKHANEGTGAHSLTKPGLIKSSFFFMSLVSWCAVKNRFSASSLWHHTVKNLYLYTPKREVRSQNKVAALKLLRLPFCLCHIYHFH